MLTRVDAPGSNKQNFGCRALFKITTVFSFFADKGSYISKSLSIISMAKSKASKKLNICNYTGTKK